MTGPSDLARKHVETLLAEAKDLGIAEDAAARALMHLAIEIFRRGRSVEDVAAELVFLADNLDEDEAYPFMRP